MNCILAILLKAATLSSDKSSLVIMSINSETPYYGVFLPVEEIYFPTPEKHSHIYMTRNTFNGEGTYLRAYCSDKLNENAIIQKVGAGLYNSGNDKETRLVRTNVGLYSCLRAFEKLRLESENSEMRLSQIVGREECPRGTIASLAFWGYCSFYGTYSNIFPKAQVKGKQINADVPLHINDETYDGKLFVGMTTPPGKQFLAWYQGNLHVFLRTKENAWYLLTDPDGRHENGVLISKLAWLTNGPFMPLHQYLAARTSETGKVSRRKKCYKFVTCKYESSNSRLTHQMEDIKLEKLEVIYAQGDFGSSPRPEYINSWMREIIPKPTQQNHGSSSRSRDTDLWMNEIYPSPDPSAESSSSQ
ncbi:unnamed protein product [Blumeria hordei]|uniref:Uncharacterized protein n=1 Tax=Blumeria hordei TaxID=2867405 RepID=A0A383UVB5_BLUHO|nr:unnamed protein product [Blumeria hordei]